MRYRLRTLLIVVFILSLTIAIARNNVIDAQRAVGSHPGEIIAVFHRYWNIWGIAFCVSLTLGVFFHRRIGLGPLVLFGLLSLFGLIVNTLLPFGLM
jgi:hypothetical protein